MICSVWQNMRCPQTFIIFRYHKIYLLERFFLRFTKFVWSQIIFFFPLSLHCEKYVRSVWQNLKVLGKIIILIVHLVWQNQIVHFGIIWGVLKNICLDCCWWAQMLAEFEGSSKWIIWIVVNEIKSWRRMVFDSLDNLIYLIEINN